MALLSDFDNGAGNLERFAAFEQVLLGTCLAYNQRASVEAVLAQYGGGTLLAYHFDDQSLPPSYMIITQGNDVFIVIAGTANIQQWAGDFGGIFATPSATGGVEVHSFFQSAQVLLTAAVLAALGPGWQGKRIHVSGHSYGAAAGQLVARELKNRSPATTVEFLGTGIPKGMTFGWTAAAPNFEAVIGTPNDIFPYVPSNHATAALGFGALFFQGIPRNWVHYGKIYLLDNFGNLDEQASTFYDGPPTGRTLIDFGTQHYVNFYLRSLNDDKNVNLARNGTGIVRNLANVLAGLAVVSGFAQNVNPNASINVPYVNAVVFQNQVGLPNAGVDFRDSGVIGLQVSGVTPATPILSRTLPDDEGFIMAGKVVFFFNMNNHAGVSDVFSVMDVPNAQQALVRTISYLNVRMPISGAQTTFRYARWSDAVNNRAPFIITAADAKLGKLIGTNNPPVSPVLFSDTGTYRSAPASRTNQDSDAPTTALLIEKRMLGHTGRMFMRGIPDVIVTKAGELDPEETRFFTLFSAYGDYVSNVANSLGANLVNLADGAKFGGKLTAVAPNASGGLDFTFDNTGFPPKVVVFAAPFNKQFSARISGCVFNQNINGPLLVESITANTCRSVKQIVSAAFTPGPQCKLVASSPLALQIQSIRLLGVSERRAGRPIKLNRGRSKNKPRG